MSSLGSLNFNSIASKYGRDKKDTIISIDKEVIEDKVKRDTAKAANWLNENWPNAIGMPIGSALGFISGPASRISKSLGKGIEALDDFGDIADYFDMIDPYGYNSEVARNDFDEPALAIMNVFQKKRLKRAEELAKEAGGTYDPGDWYDSDKDINEKPAYSPEFKKLVDQKIKELGPYSRYIQTTRLKRDGVDEGKIANCMFYNLQNPDDNRNLFLNTDECPQEYIDFYTNYYKANAAENQIRNCKTSDPINSDKLTRDRSQGLVKSGYQYPYTKDIYKWQCSPNNLNAVRYNPFNDNILNLYGYWELIIDPATLSQTFPTTFNSYLEINMTTDWEISKSEFNILGQFIEVQNTVIQTLEQAKSYAALRGFDILCHNPNQLNFKVSSSKFNNMQMGTVSEGWTTYLDFSKTRDKIMKQEIFMLQTSPTKALAQQQIGRAQLIIDKIFDCGSATNADFTALQTPVLPPSTSDVLYTFTVDVYIDPLTINKEMCIFSRGTATTSTVTNLTGPSPALYVVVSGDTLTYRIRQQLNDNTIWTYDLTSINLPSKGFWNNITICVNTNSAVALINGLVDIPRKTSTKNFSWSTNNIWKFDPLSTINQGEVLIKNFYWWNQDLSTNSPWTTKNSENTYTQLERLYEQKTFLLNPSYTLINQPLTVSCWIFIYTNQDLTRRVGIIIGNFDEINNTTFNVEIFTNNNFRIHIFGQSLVFTSFRFDVNKWYHLTVTRTNISPLSATLYVNGQVKQTLTYSNSSQANVKLDNYYVGSDARIQPFFFNGEISSLKIFWTQLSAAQVQNLFDNEIAQFKKENPESIIGEDPITKYLIDKKLEDNSAKVISNKIQLGTLLYQNIKNSNGDDIVSYTLTNSTVPILGTIKRNVINQPDTIEWSNNTRWRLLEKLWQNNGQLECLSKDGINCDNMLIWPAKSMNDQGYPDTQTRLFKRGYYDIVGQGKKNDYCRYIGTSNESSTENSPIHFSCRLSTGTAFASNKYGNDVNVDATVYNGLTISEIIGSKNPIYEPNPITKITNNFVKFESQKSSLCIAPQDDKGSNNTPLTQTNCTDPYSYLTIDSANNRIRSTLNSKCLTVIQKNFNNNDTTSADANDNRIVLSECAQGNSQQSFTYNPTTKYIQKVGTNKCIAIGGVDKNKLNEILIQWDCPPTTDNNPVFKWDQIKGDLPEGWYDIQNQGVSNDYCQYYPNSKSVLQTSTFPTRFRIQMTFGFTSATSRLCLQAGTTQGSNIQCRLCNDAEPNQIFTFDPLTEEILTNSGFAFDISGNSTAESAPVISWPRSTNINHKFVYNSETKNILALNSYKCLAANISAQTLGDPATYYGTTKVLPTINMILRTCQALPEFRIDLVPVTGVTFSTPIYPVDQNFDKFVGVDIPCSTNQCLSSTLSNISAEKCGELCADDERCQGFSYYQSTKSCRLNDGVLSGTVKNNNSVLYRKKQYLPEMRCNISSSPIGQISDTYKGTNVSDIIQINRTNDIRQPYSEPSRTRLQESSVILLPTAQTASATPEITSANPVAACDVILPSIETPQGISCNAIKIVTAIQWANTTLKPGINSSQQFYNIRKSEIPSILTILKSNFANTKYSVNISTEKDLLDVVNKNKKTICNWGHYVASDKTIKTGLPQFIFRDAQGTITSGQCESTNTGIIPIIEPETNPRSLFITIEINDPNSKLDTAITNEVISLIEKTQFKNISNAFITYVLPDIKFNETVCGQGKTFLDKIDEKSNIAPSKLPTTDSSWKGCQETTDIFGNKVWFDSKLRLPYDFAQNGGHCFPTAEERTVCEPIDCIVTPWYNLKSTASVKPLNDTAILFGDFIQGEKPVEQTLLLPFNERVFAIYEAPHTKMITQAGDARFFEGALNTFDKTKWSTYTKTDGIKLKWQLGSEANTWSDCNVSDYISCKNLQPKISNNSATDIEKRTFNFNNCSQVLSLISTCSNLQTKITNLTEAEKQTYNLYKCANREINKTKCSSIESKILDNTATAIEKTNYFNRWNCVPYIQKRVREQANNGPIYGGQSCPIFTEYKLCPPEDCQMAANFSDYKVTNNTDKYFIWIVALGSSLPLVTTTQAQSIIADLQKIDIKARIATNIDLSKFNQSISPAAIFSFPDGYKNIGYTATTQTITQNTTSNSIAILSTLNLSQIKSWLNNKGYFLINDISQVPFTTERNLSQECIMPKGSSFYCNWADQMERVYGREKTSEEKNYCQTINVNRTKEMKKEVISEGKFGGTECPNPFKSETCKATGEPFRYRQTTTTTTAVSEANLLNQTETVVVPTIPTTKDTVASTLPNCEVSTWSNFSSCYFDSTLNKWVQKRYRQVLTTPQQGGSCPQALDANNNNNYGSSGLVQVQDCAPVNCQVSAFGDWNGCFKLSNTYFSSTDPNSSFNGKWAKVRTRQIIQAPKYGGQSCQPLFELAECSDATKGGNLVQNCQVSDWSSFTNCYRDAADNNKWKKSRFKTILQGPLYGGSECPPPTDLIQTVDCTTADGVGNVEFNTVSEADYSAPIKVGTAFVQQARKTIKSIPVYPLALPLTTDYIATKSVQPVNCVVGWQDVKDASSDWTNCYKNDAGNWVRSKFQEIITPAAYGGQSCPTNLVTTESCVKVDCQYNDWSAYSSCYFDNDGGYKQSRTRSVKNHGSFGGAECKQSELIETKNCPVSECQVSAWIEPQGCYIDSDPSSSTYGQWVETRTRNITQMPVGTTVPCPPLVETKLCTKNVNCVVETKEAVGDFAWTDRCFTNSSGQKVRARVAKEISRQAQYGGDSCPPADDLIEYKACDIQPKDCQIGWNGQPNEWSSWSGCFLDDDGKYKEVRTKQVIQQPENGGECNFTIDDLIEEKTCDAIDCKFNTEGPTNCYQKEDGNWYQSTFKIVTQIPLNGGQECPTELIEETLCSTIDCKAGFMNNGTYVNEWRDYDGKCYQKETNGPLFKLQFKNIIEDGRNGGRMCEESDLFQEVQCTQAELNALTAQAQAQTVPAARIRSKFLY